MPTQTFFKVIEIGSNVGEKKSKKTWTQYFSHTKKQTCSVSAVSLLKYQRRYLQKMHLGAFLNMQAHFYMTEIASMTFILQQNC